MTLEELRARMSELCTVVQASSGDTPGLLKALGELTALIAEYRSRVNALKN